MAIPNRASRSDSPHPAGGGHRCLREADEFKGANLSPGRVTRRVGAAILCVFIALSGESARTQVAPGTATIGKACSKLNEDALAQVAQGLSAQAEKLLSAAL